VKLETFLAEEGPVIRRASLDRAGQRTLESAVAARLVMRLLPGTYALRDAAPDLRVRALAVARWHPDAVITGRAAARLTFCHRPARTVRHGRRAEGRTAGRV